MSKYLHKGKVKNKTPLPDGLYHQTKKDKYPVLVDDKYKGFKMVFFHHVETETVLTHYIISDSMDGTKNPIDGKMYDSKAKYYQTVKEAGCEIVGNDSSLTKSQQPRELSSNERKADIARTMSQLGY